MSNFEQRRQCAAPHSVADHGTWTRGADEALGVIICANGTRQYKMRCRVCGTTGSPVPTKLLTAWGLAPADVEWERANAPAVYEPCRYAGCGRTPTEYHHFAPRNTFGSDADSWPVLPLCVAHHRDWHQRMDGYRWHAKGVAA